MSLPCRNGYFSTSVRPARSDSSPLRTRAVPLIAEPATAMCTGVPTGVPSRRYVVNKTLRSPAYRANASFTVPGWAVPGVIAASFSMSGVMHPLDEPARRCVTSLTENFTHPVTEREGAAGTQIVDEEVTLSAYPGTIRQLIVGGLGCSPFSPAPSAPVSDDGSAPATPPLPPTPSNAASSPPAASSSTKTTPSSSASTGAPTHPSSARPTSPTRPSPGGRAPHPLRIRLKIGPNSLRENRR